MASHQKLGPAIAAFESGALRKAAGKTPQVLEPRPTTSGVPVHVVHQPAPDAVADEPFLGEVGFPGEPPFTRGIHPTMYRSKLWTMRQYAGFGTAEESNARYRYLLSQGQTGLSVAFDLPTQMGLDPDHPRALGEVGRVGVSIATLGDMDTLFKEIPLQDVSVSMTINATATTLLGLMCSVASQRNVPWSALNGTVQNDILKEYMARGTYIYPPTPSLRLTTDLFAFCAEQVPNWNTISISGYHIREAGATAVQELAFTLADGIGYLQAGVDAGLDPDVFAPRLSFFFDVHNDFFEEIAKLRAARRIWAKVTKERFGCKNPRSWVLRTHCQTAGVSLTAQQPYNNVVRTTWQALAAVLGGTQSLHTNSLDETYALPTEEAATTALRTQQLLFEEARVAMVADPLGGSYFVEALTDQVEEAAMRYIKKIDEMGGILHAVEEGFPQREIAESAYKFQKALEEGDEAIVGITKYVTDGDAKIPTLKIDHQGEKDQVNRVKAVRARRDQARAKACLDRIEACCRGTENMMPAMIEAAKADCTLGEMCDVFRKVWGVHRDPAYL